MTNIFITGQKESSTVDCKGRSLFSGDNLFFLRYNLSKDRQFETQTGQESGVDTCYKSEFY